MATKADFTAEEWGKLLGSPMVVGMVDYRSGPEWRRAYMAGGWALVEARQSAQANLLVEAIAKDLPQVTGGPGSE